MRTSLLLSLICLATLANAPVLADPGVTASYQGDLLRVTLNGSYVGSYYRVWRSSELAGQFEPLSFEYTLCTGDCFVGDDQARPGRTYYYRFDLDTPRGFVSYGPYAVTVPDTPLGARIWPNPSSGQARIDLSVPGSRRFDGPLAAVATIIDLQGRRVRVLYSGVLTRGVTSVAWDGTNEGGQPLDSGLYFLHLVTPLGASTSRIVRVR